jgi:hypothetical protein
MEAPEERIMACLGKMEAMDLKANPEEMQSKVEQWEVHKEDAIVKPVGGQKKRHRGQNLAAERCQKSKERIRGNCGSQKKLAVTGMKTT